MILEKLNSYKISSFWLSSINTHERFIKYTLILNENWISFQFTAIEDMSTYILSSIKLLLWLKIKKK